MLKELFEKTVGVELTASPVEMFHAELGMCYGNARQADLHINMLDAKAELSDSEIAEAIVGAMNNPKRALEIAAEMISWINVNGDE